MKVKLSEWFPKGTQFFDSCKVMVDRLFCRGCKRAIQYDDAWGDHTLPWGIGGIWCNRCHEKGKK